MTFSDFSRAMYDKLVPHVTVLPPSADRINVCTADGVVLDYLSHEGQPVRIAFSFTRDGKIQATHCVPTEKLPERAACA